MPKRLWLGLSVALVLLGPARDSGATDPAGGPCPPHLFVLGRSKNANIVVYDAKPGAAGDLDPAEPVVVYWLLNGEPGAREELNFVERQRAYGVDTAPGDAPGTYTMTFKASRKRHFTIRILNGCPVVTTSIGKQDGILRRIFVAEKEGRFQPKIKYVEFFGEDLAAGGPLYEKMVPK